MSRRTSSRSIFTTTPSTRSPSLKSLRLSSMALISSSGVRSAWATVSSVWLSIPIHSSRARWRRPWSRDRSAEGLLVVQDRRAAGAGLVYRRPEWTVKLSRPLWHAGERAGRLRRLGRDRLLQQPVPGGLLDEDRVGH